VRLMKRSPPTRITAAIFDLDGTLLESGADIRAACNHMLTALGRSPLDAEVVRGFVGDGARALVARALGDGATEDEIARNLEVFLEYYAAHPADLGQLYEGARDLLEWLGPSRVGICTNKSRRVTLSVVEALHLKVGFVVAGGDTLKLKPSPDPVFLACSGLGVDPNEVVFVGDSEQDVLAARAAGCFAVGVLGGLGSEARLVGSEPDWLSPSLSTLNAEMRSWNFV
jgi:phosphoglycolate phosphatase